MGGSKKPADRPPIWNEIYIIAKEFSIPPWVVETDCPGKWRKQILEHIIAESEENKRRARKMKRKRGNAKRKN